MRRGHLKACPGGLEVWTPHLQEHQRAGVFRSLRTSHESLSELRECFPILTSEVLFTFMALGAVVSPILDPESPVPSRLKPQPYTLHISSLHILKPYEALLVARTHTCFVAPTSTACPASCSAAEDLLGGLDTLCPYPCVQHIHNRTIAAAVAVSCADRAAADLLLSISRQLRFPTWSWLLFVLVTGAGVTVGIRLLLPVVLIGSLLLAGL